MASLGMHGHNKVFTYLFTIQAQVKVRNKQA